MPGVDRHAIRGNAVGIGIADGEAAGVGQAAVQEVDGVIAPGGSHVLPERQVWAFGLRPFRGARSPFRRCRRFLDRADRLLAG